MKFGCPGINFLAPLKMEEKMPLDDEKTFKEGGEETQKQKYPMKIQGRHLMNY